MFSKSTLAFVTLAVLSASEQVLGRERWLERDNKAVFLYPRRFGQEQPAVIQKLGAACPGQVCGVLSGQAITPLLAAQPECSQQDMADAIIDAAAQFDAATQANMIALAIEYRQAEKNTPPDFTTNPPSLRNSVFCQKAPKNSQLNGLVQAQDPSNDPTLFFDPATSKTVLKGSQADTFPFGQASASLSAAATSTSAAGTAILAVAASSTDCPSVVTVTVAAEETSTADASACTTDITVTVTATESAAAETTAAAAATTTSVAAATTTNVAAVATSTASANTIGNFGSCTVPQIEFGVGFDNRKETSFEPVDKTSFNHGSAQGIDIITKFICDTLTNSCGADQTAKDTCATASTAADAATKGTGAQADAFNAVFGITTQFVDIASVDDQGRVIAGTGSSSAAADAATSAAAVEAATSVAAGATSVAAAASTAVAATSTAGSSIGNFGSCTVPQIEFATGFDNRRETSFQPVDQVSYNHGSADNIDIITQFMCDTLVNTCGADQTAKDTCASAKTAADTGAKGTGAQADAFNAVFGITTRFVDVVEVDNTGKAVPGTGSSAAAAVVAVSSSTVAAATTAAATAAAAATTSAAAATGANLQTFTGSLGATPPTVTALANGQFQVTGNSAFNSEQNALVRSCDVQHNQCANAANASGNKAPLTVDACGTQQTQCNAAATA